MWNIRIWNFHTGLLIKKIKVYFNLKDSCLWNNTYIFVGSHDKKIKLVDLKNGIVIKSFTGHKNIYYQLKKLIILIMEYV